ncbi:hypothetical protein AAEO56_04605 [Flavobacterium sp. DGU11]|uniref:Uncharacterized protein n=1 Tax=Flavobacterium arundinis TaxID=3139143 RepID=A0ABU9HUX6_9FLAO
MKVFKIALAGTGIGIIVLALGYLIGNFEKVKKAVMSFIPGLEILGDIFSGLVNWVTDFVGATSDASRALDKLEADAQENLKRDELAYEANSDLYDEFTNRKKKAALDYRNKIGELNRDEKLSVEQKEQAIADAHARMLRDIEQADKDSAAQLTKFLDGYRKRDEDATAKTNREKIDLAEKRALEELEIDENYEIKSAAIKEFYANERDRDAAKEAKERQDKADQDRKKANEEAKKRRDDIKKILEDYDKKEIDALADTNLKKINIEQERAIKELEILGATRKQKERINKYYDDLRKKEEEKQVEELKQVAKGKELAQKNLQLNQKQWEADNEIDPLVKLKKEREIIKEQAAMEFAKLQEDIKNAKLFSKERADAEAQYAMAKQNLQQAQSENDNQQKKILADNAAAAAEKEKEKADKKKKDDEELAKNKMDLAFVTSSYLSDLMRKDSDKKDERTDEEKEEDRSVAQNRLNVAGNTAKMLLEMGGKGAELAKGMAVSQAIQDTYKGATAAYASMAEIPIVGPALGAAAAGVAVASGLMNVKKILATKPVEKSAPGGAGAGGGAAAPAFNLVQGTGTNQIAEAIGGQNTPIQAYVVSSNVTSAQSLDRNIVEQSTL